MEIIINSIVLEQHLGDKHSNTNIVQASFDGLIKPVQSTFNGKIENYFTISNSI